MPTPNIITPPPGPPNDEFGKKKIELAIKPGKSTADDVAAFLGEKAREAGAPEPGKPAEPLEPKAPPQVHIPPNTDFDRVPTPSDDAMMEGLVDPNDVAITDEDRVLFLKAILNDVHVRMTVSIFGGNMNLEIRSRSVYEQRRILDIAFVENNKKEMDAANYGLMVHKHQRYCCLLMVERINGKPFSELVLAPGRTVDEDRETLETLAEEKFDLLNANGQPAMSMPKWTAMMNAIRVFERKCAQMSGEAIKGDFTKLQG
jgi:hypothetical protein